MAGSHVRDGAVTGRRGRGKGAGHGVPASGLPARGGPNRPPFEAGNVLALHHGARSPRVYEPAAAELVAGLLADRPDLDAPSYRHAVHAWATAEARAMLLDKALAEQGTVDEHGAPRDALLAWWTRMARLANELRQRLGLDPRSHAELTRSRVEATRVAADLEEVRARGREVLAARAEVQAVEAVEAGDDGGDVVEEGRDDG